MYNVPSFPPGGGPQRFPTRDLCAHLALARSSQERTQARQVLPVRVRFEVRLRLRQPLSLREGCLTRYWYVEKLHSRQHHNGVIKVVELCLW